MRRSTLIGVGLAGLAVVLVLAITLPIVLTRNGNSSSSNTSSSTSLAVDAGPVSPTPSQFPSAHVSDVPSSDPTMITAAPSPMPTPGIVSARPSFRPSWTQTELPADNLEEQEAAEEDETTSDASAAANSPSTSMQCEEYSKIFDLCIDNDVPYYHCGQNKDKVGTDILLLHGASFTKENWRRKDIIDDLCEHVTVVASDLSVSADSNVLKSMLDRLEAAGVVRLPLTVVTPSASGRSIVSWIMGSSPLVELPNYVSTWVPVAPYSVFSATDEQISALKALKVGILATYGDRDKSGGRVSERLGDLADATVVELEGGHAVYLSSPEEFSETVLEFLDVDT